MSDYRHSLPVVTKIGISIVPPITAGVVFASLAPFVGFGPTMLIPVFLYTSSFVALLVIGVTIWELSITKWIGWFMLCAVVTVIGYQVELWGLTALWHQFPPPRPMFACYFGEDEKALLPRWAPVVSYRDEAGLSWFSDDEDNTVVLIVTNARWAVGHVSSDTETMKMTVFDLSDDTSIGAPVISRCTNALVIVCPTSENCSSYPLRHGAAARLSMLMSSNDDNPSCFDEVMHFVDRDTRVTAEQRVAECRN
jgi:hypothetical protein